ncbi:MAG: GNAT family N-acetyltransferase [Candidatus Coatesbacteria bacterium]
MIVRSATAGDIPAMLALWRQFWKPQPYEANLPMKIEREPDLVVVAEDGGRIVGTVIGGSDLWWAWIYRVAVDRECHQKGVGTALLKEILQRFKARGIHGADLIVSPGNEPMLALVRKLGGREHADRRYSIGF